MSEISPARFLAGLAGQIAPFGTNAGGSSREWCRMTLLEISYETVAFKHGRVVPVVRRHGFGGSGYRANAGIDEDLQPNRRPGDYAPSTEVSDWARQRRIRDRKLACQRNWQELRRYCRFA